jgi:hypothetical protein
MVAERVAARARRILRTDLWVAIAPTALIVVAAFGITMFFVKPAPPVADEPAARGAVSAEKRLG